MADLHNRLKEWLITLGRENGYEAWTPDALNNVEFSKIRDAKVDYRPDVVWKNKRTREKVFFELSFQEDFRQIAGEVFLASQVENFSKIFIIRVTDDESYWKNIERFLRFAFKKDGIFKIYEAHRPRFIILGRSMEETEMKEKIVQALKYDRWIKQKDEDAKL